MKVPLAILVPFFFSAFASAAGKVTPVIFKLERGIEETATQALAVELKKDPCISDASNGLGSDQGLLFVTLKGGCYEQVDHAALAQKIAKLTGTSVRKATYTYTDIGGGEETYSVQTGNFLVYKKREISDNDMSARIKASNFVIIATPTSLLPAFLVRKENVIGHYLENGLLKMELEQIEGVRFVQPDNPTFITKSRPEVIEHPDPSQLEHR
ncbi:MAG: hypothetical protein K2X47_12275 [Bdellovibrionales bacterium]|nr:hypothetical protein [Bdellovibrionales bacterium]